MNDTQRRLKDDAGGLASIQVSTERQLAFRDQLSNARQQRDGATPNGVRERGWWVSGLVAASVAIAVLSLRLTNEPGAPATTGSTPTPATISATPPPTSARRPVLRPLGELARLEQVSHAAALEQEWVNIRKDFEQAREQIEADLPVRF